MPRDIPIGFLRQVLADPIITLVWVDSEIMHAAVALLLARRDKHYSLCHAVSFLVMRERGLTEALTTDHHFDQEGFQRLLDP
jgi:predicted nucleic acid-binding protein